MRHFEKAVKSTRVAFGNAVYDLAKEDERIAAVAADTATNLGLGKMMEDYPDRVINTGIAEQNMMDISAGMAATGFRVYACSYSPFLTMRALEQFRTFVAYPGLNVQLAGGMGGISAGEEGVSHQGTEDAALIRCIAGTAVICPADYDSCYKIVKAMGNHEGPVYYRLDKLPYRKVFDENYEFRLGKANLLQDGTDITVIASGMVVSRAMQAADLLGEAGISVRLLEMPCIKPIDEEAIISAARETGAILTVEEGVLQGGLGSAVAEVVCQNAPVIMKNIGLDNCFAQSGDVDLLLDAYGMSPESIAQEAQKLIDRKNKEAVQR